MPVRILRNILLFLFFTGMLTVVFFCTPSHQAEQEDEPSSAWRNVYDTSVHYVGMQTCRTCHEEVYANFIQTGMGQSFHYATKEKSAADFSAHALVYDKDLDFYYKPFWQGDSLFILEYRIDGKDTVHKRVQHINYIIGSGQHTNSHIFEVNGYLYQAPITFYTQKGKWDLAPGYEEGASSRFSRIIQTECMTCHNGYPEFVPGSQNKFITLKTGIDCERCHGPGSLHVAEKQSGIIVDTSKGPDYSIVNPRRLPVSLQNDVCQRCHLQGISVLHDNKTFFDFHPGMQLSEVMSVFMPEYEGAADKMIMASHVERMKKSDCYINSGQMSCISCHDPHRSVKFTPRVHFNNACMNCHGGAQQSFCLEEKAVRAKNGDDCVGCHMPKNESIDIPHVAVTDHFIRKPPFKDSTDSKIRAFLGMRSYNDDNPSPITVARAYMEFFERYNPNKGLLDSALYYLNKQQDEERVVQKNQNLIRVYYLMERYDKVMELAANLQPEEIEKAWTAYRIGEAFFQSNKAEAALPWYKRATEIEKYTLDFQNKYGICLLALNKHAEAKKVYEFILAEQPDYTIANTNLGFLYLQQGNAVMAYDLLSRAQVLDPDNVQTLINLAVWHHAQMQYNKAGRLLRQVLKKQPEHAQARAMLLDLERYQ